MLNKITPYLFLFVVGFAVGFYVHDKYVCKGETVVIKKAKAKGSGKQNFDVEQYGRK